MTTTWTIAIDWDRNGNYSDTYDDVTVRVISANWFLAKLLADPDQWREMGTCGRALVKEHFTWDAAELKLEQVYLSLLPAVESDGR